MGRVLFCWELGDNFGHLARDLPVARRLRERGFDVAFAVRDMRIAQSVLKPDGFRFFQAPRLSRKTNDLTPASYAEVLLSYGYSSERALFPLVGAWFEVFRNVNPDVVILNHAPTAALAAQCMAVPAVATCIGFELPPPQVVRWPGREDVPIERLQGAQDIVLANINYVLRHHALQSIDNLSQLFSRATVLMTTFRELDHYGPRPHLEYLGYSADIPADGFVWKTQRRRVFCYLRTSTPNFHAIVVSLGAREWEVLCIVPDASDELLASVNFDMRRRPVSQAAIGEAELVITYGTGTFHDALSLGKPVLMTPSNVEQLMAAMRVVKLDAGLILPPGSGTATALKIIRLMLEDGRWASAAMRFSSMYSDFDRARAAESVIDQITVISSLPKLAN